MPFTPPAPYPYSDDSSPGANDGDIVYAESVNSVMEYLQDVLPTDILDAAGATASDLDPADLGTTDPGVSNELSRSDHVHQMPSAADVGAATESFVTTAISTHSAATDPHGDRAYADALFDQLNGTDYQGSIDCSGNPDYPAADADHSYRVSAPGKIGGASGADVEIGDVAICLANGTPSGDQATVGANWTIVQNNLNGVVIGPSSSTDNRLALFSGTSGRLLKQSSLLISELQTTAYTVADTNDWPGADPTTVVGALDTLASRATDTEASALTTRVIQILVTDPNGAALTTGDGKAFVCIPPALNGLDITAVHAAVTTTSASGAITVQIARVRAGTPADTLSTALTIDESESTSTTAATAAVINTSNDDLATADFLRIDIDGAGSGAKGLIVTITAS